MIGWKDVAEDPARFERVVKMLIRRLHPEAQGMDGRGGDGGVDAWLDTDLGPVIFEIKSFTERLTKSQKGQIEKSLATAARHQPSAWKMIIPLEHTPAEKKWFDQLKARYPKILLLWQGIDWLDEQVARHGDLLRYLEGNVARRLARTEDMLLEQAALTRIPDLDARVSRLSGRAGEISPYYNAGFAAHGGRRWIMLSPKQTFGGVSIIPQLQIPADDAAGLAAQRGLERVLAYGGSTVIEGRFVEALHVFDAETLVERLEELGDGAVQVVTPQEETAPVLCRLVALTPDGQEAAVLDLSLTGRTTGRAGRSVHGKDLHDLVQVTIHLDHPEEGAVLSGGMNLQLSSLAGHWPSALRPVADLLITAQKYDLIEVQLDRKPVARGHAHSSLAAPVLDAARLVVVLDELRQLTGTHFPIPAVVMPAEVAMLAVLRDLHAVGKAVMPRGTISVGVTEHGRITALKMINDNDGCALTVDVSWGQSCAGHAFPPVDVRIYGSHVRLTNRAELEAARPTDADSVIAHFTCADGQSLEIHQQSPPSGQEG